MDYSEIPPTLMVKSTNYGVNEVLETLGR